MIYLKWKCMVVACLAGFQSANGQFAVPIYPPSYAIPYPIQFAVMPFAIRLPDPTTTKSTTEPPKKIAIAVPMPYAVGYPVAIVPRPVVMVAEVRHDVTLSEESSVSSASSSRERKRRHRNRRRRKRLRIGRRSKGSGHDRADGDKLVKPVLTYISKSGDVKLKKQMSRLDADELIEDKA